MRIQPEVVTNQVELWHLCRSARRDQRSRRSGNADLILPSRETATCRGRRITAIGERLRYLEVFATSREATRCLAAHHAVDESLDRDLGLRGCHRVDTLGGEHHAICHGRAKRQGLERGG